MMNNIIRPSCYNAFYSTRPKIADRKDNSAPRSVKIASIIGSGMGALGAAYVISRKQTKLLNKNINVFNIKYTEPELLSVALGSVAGGFTAGTMIDDKKYIPAKTREAVHQVLANIVAPLAIIGAANKIFDKIEPKLKLPQFNSTKNFVKHINTTIKVLPRLLLTFAGLVAGLYAGTKVANMLNGTDKTVKARKVKALDYIYHPDDFATALVLADKNGIIQNTVGKIIPPVFMMHGYEAGSKR